MFNTELNKLINSINGDTFFIGDTHFYHENISKYEPIRLKVMKEQGFSNLDDWLIYNWNQTVGVDDLVIHVGDFAFKNINNLVGKLNGKLILILGNHDRKGLQTYNNIFDHIIRGSYMTFNDKLYIANSDDELFSSLIIPYDNQMLLISHYPATEQEKKWYVLSDEAKKNMHEGQIKGKENMVNRLSHIIELADENNIDINVHGHTHSHNVIDDTQMFDFINCSVENIGFKPIRLKELLKKK